MKVRLQTLTLLLAILTLNANAQKIYTFAGNGTPGFAGDGLVKEASVINFPQAIIFDSAGNLYFADANNNRIRKIDTNGIVTTVAGNGTTAFVAGPALATGFSLPDGLAIDSHGDIYITDSFNNAIRKLTVSTGVVSTVAGTGVLGYTGDSGPATNATLNWPRGICIDNSDNLYIADNNNHVVRKVTPAGIISTIAGNGFAGYNGDNISALTASLKFPSGVAVDASGNVFIADNTNNRVRRVDASTGIITTIAGDGTSGPIGSEAGPATGGVVSPTGLVWDNAGGILYVADELHSRVRAIDLLAGTMNTVAGTTVAGYNGDRIKADQAQLKGSVGVAIDAMHNLFIADAANNRLRWIPNRFVTTWKTDNAGVSASNQITIPTDDLVNPYNIHWQEVGVPANNGDLLNQVGPATVTFPNAGTYRVEIYGDFTHIFFQNDGNPSDNQKILTVDQWGAIAWKSMAGAFTTCPNLTVAAIDIPDLSNVSDMSMMFMACPHFNAAIGDWEVSNVTDMNGTFQYATSFNQDIGSWNVGQVTNMRTMFANATVFNQNLNSWNVGNVTDFIAMFFNAVAFNGNIASWNTGSATTMELMFYSTLVFNQDIGSWNVGAVTTMNSMFYNALVFDQDLSAWDFSKVTDMNQMLDNSGLSMPNYDLFLAAVAQKDLSENITLGAAGLKYCSAKDQRQMLIARGWMINGDSEGCIVVPPTILVPKMNVKYRGDALAQGNSITFPKTGVGLSTSQILRIKNVGDATLVISDIQVTGNSFSLGGTAPTLINPADSAGIEIKFEPTDLGTYDGAVSILSNDSIPVYTLNITAEGDADIEVYNVVTANQNGKHDFLNIRNIELFPENRVTIYDRWGNLVFEKSGYNNTDNYFAGVGDNNKLLADGTYYYVIDKNNGSANKTGFLLLRR